MTEDITLTSLAGNFPGYINKPDGDIKGGLIVIHEVWGLTDHIKSVTDRFASEGYLVLAPELFSDLDMPPVVLDEIQRKLFDPEHSNEVQPKLRELTAPIHTPEFSAKTLTKLKACFDYLVDREETEGKVGAIGFCFGGSYSYVLAINEPRLKAAAAFYGHCDAGVDELKKIKCPVVAFIGEKDQNLMSALPDLKTRMHEAGVDFTSTVYPNCGHAFFNDTNKFAYDADAATDACQKVTTFFENKIV